MESLKYDLKLYLQDSSSVGLEEFIPIFHRWIQEQNLQEVLIDVADYRHVQHGPGVILVGHDAHYAMDLAEGRMGLLYSRRRETHPSRSAIQDVTERLSSVFHCALTACQHLESETSFQGRLRFRGDTLLLRLNDRLLAAHTSEVYEDLRHWLEPFLAQLYPGVQVELECAAAAGSRLEVVIKAAGSPEVATLLERLGGNGFAPGELSNGP